MAKVSSNEMARFKVTLASGEVTQASPKGLEALMVEDHIDMVGVAELTFGGGSGTTFASLPIGSDVEITIGGSTVKVFSGVIAGLRHGYSQSKDTLTIMCMDPLAKLAASRVTKVYEEMTDSDIINQVFGEAGVTAGTVDSTSEARPYTFQRNESNLSFGRRLAARNGFMLRANEGKVDFSSAELAGGQSVEIPKEDLISLDYSFSTKSIPKKLTAYGWDYKTKKKVEGTATEADVKPIGSEGKNGVEATGIVFEGESYISDVLIDSQAGATEVAKAELNRLARNLLRGRAIVQGNGAIHAGVTVKFSGHQTGFNPEAYVISARHRIYIGSGTTTEIVFCSNTLPGDPSGGASDQAASDAASAAPVSSAPQGSQPSIGGGDIVAGDRGSSGGLGGMVGGALDKAGQAAKDAVGDVADDAKDMLGKVDDAISDLGDEARAISDGLAEQAHGVVDAIGEEVHGAISEVSQQAQDAVAEAKEELQGVVDDAGDKAKELGGKAADSVGGAVGDVLGDKIGDKVTDELNGAVNDAVDDAVSDVNEQLDEAEQQVQDAIKDAEKQAHEAVKGVEDKAHEAINDANEAVNEGITEVENAGHEAVDQAEKAVDKAVKKSEQAIDGAIGGIKGRLGI